MTQMVIPENQSKIEAAFWDFHESHPEVYAELVRLAREAKARGRDRIGMKMLFEIVRWNRLLTVRDEHGFRLNNNYTALYSRLIQQQEPDLDGMFATRKLAVPSHVV